MKIKEGKIVLRKFRKGDELFLAKFLNNRNISKYLCNVHYPYTLKDAKKWIAHCLKMDRLKKKKQENFIIEFEGESVGSIGLKKIKVHKAEIGYWISQNNWGKGIMTKSVKLVTRYGFAKLKLKRIYAYVFEKNKNSARVLEKCKYNKEGLLRKDRIKDGKLVDVYVYARVK